MLVMGSYIVSAFVVSIVCLLSLCALPCYSLRSGAPALACSLLIPFHGFTRPKPASSSPFNITQSSYEYAPDSNITVTIGSHSPNRFFRGFIVQAYDPTTNNRIGHFFPTIESRPIHSCSAATHRNNEQKQTIQLIWTSHGGPQHRHSTRPLFNFGFGPRITARETVSENLPGSNNDTGYNRSNVPHKKIKFRGTIVVSFDDFYHGFESSERAKSVDQEQQQTTQQPASTDIIRDHQESPPAVGSTSQFESPPVSSGATGSAQVRPTSQHVPHQVSAPVRSTSPGSASASASPGGLASTPLVAPSGNTI